MLVKAQIMSLSVLICESFPNFSLHHAAALPVVFHLLPSCWRAEVGWGGKEVHVRFYIAIDKSCRAERWFDSSVGRWGPQAAEQVSIIFCASFSCIVMDSSAPWFVSCISMWPPALSQRYSSAPDKCSDPGWDLLWLSIRWEFWGRTLIARTTFTHQPLAFSVLPGHPCQMS